MGCIINFNKEDVINDKSYNDDKHNDFFTGESTEIVNNSKQCDAKDTIEININYIKDILYTINQTINLNINNTNGIRLSLVCLKDHTDAVMSNVNSKLNEIRKMNNKIIAIRNEIENIILNNVNN